jgi:hypothetical protein
LASTTETTTMTRTTTSMERARARMSLRTICPPREQKLPRSGREREEVRKRKASGANADGAVAGSGGAVVMSDGIPVRPGARARRAACPLLHVCLAFGRLPAQRTAGLGLWPEGAACGCGCGWGDVSTVHRRYTPDGAYRIAYLTALMNGTSS